MYVQSQCNTSNTDYHRLNISMLTLQDGLHGKHCTCYRSACSDCLCERLTFLFIAWLKALECRGLSSNRQQHCEGERCCRWLGGSADGERALAKTRRVLWHRVEHWLGFCRNTTGAAMSKYVQVCSAGGLFSNMTLFIQDVIDAPKQKTC